MFWKESSKWFRFQFGFFLGTFSNDSYVIWKFNRLTVIFGDVASSEVTTSSHHFNWHLLIFRWIEDIFDALIISQVLNKSKSKLVFYGSLIR